MSEKPLNPTPIISIIVIDKKVTVKLNITFPWWYAVIGAGILIITLAAVGDFPQAIEAILRLLSLAA